MYVMPTGRYGCTGGCLSTGFCLLNNAAIALVYARSRWGLDRIAVVDIDVHFGNGTAELLKNDPGAFFASVHMIYGDENKGMPAAEAEVINPEVAQLSSSSTQSKTVKSSNSDGFYPAELGTHIHSFMYLS